jgi:hypothetical protein
MEANRWTMEHKPHKYGVISDWYYFLPGLTHGQRRKDFFDTVKALMEYLKHQTDDALAQFVYEFYNQTQKVAKEEREILAKMKKPNYDQFLEKIARKVNILVPLPGGIIQTEEIIFLCSKFS